MNINKIDKSNQLLTCSKIKIKVTATFFLLFKMIIYYLKS